MRIAIFSDVFYPELSGISDSIISLAKELSDMGHEIKFYVPRYSEKNYGQIGLAEKEIILGKNISIVRLFSVPYPTGTGQGRLVIPSPFILWNVKKFNPDVIHTQLFFGAGLEAILSAKILKRPLVGTNHTAIKEFMKYGPLNGEWASNAMLRYVNWYYGKCDLIAVPSRSVTDEMKFYGFDKNVHVISNPVDTKIFFQMTGRKLLKKKFGLGDYVVIHAGRLSQERKVDLIIRALALVKKEFPGAELAIAGDGTEREGLGSLAVKLGIKSSVKLMGFLEKSVFVETYNAGEIFAITSTSDTQSMVMMQAMACGLPVIGVNARALPEYINKNNGILIEPDNPEILAKKIIFLFKNPEIRKRLGAGARKFALNFSSKNIAEEWVKIYEKAIKEYNVTKLKRE